MNFSWDVLADGIDRVECDSGADQGSGWDVARQGLGQKTKLRAQPTHLYRHLGLNGDHWEQSVPYGPGYLQLRKVSDHILLK